MKFKLTLFLLGLIVLLGIEDLNAQKLVFDEDNQPAADKIIGIVGQRIILKSELDNMIVQQMEQSKGNLPENLNCALFEQMLAQNALAIQAERDSLPVDDDRVEQQLDQRINYFQSLYGSRKKMEEVLGQSIYQIKDKYREDIKDMLLAQAMRENIVDEVKITPTEVRAYFDSIPPDSLRFFKSEVEVGQIVIKPEPDSSVVNYTIRQLNDLRDQALSGDKSFASLADLYSNDVATGSNILTIDRSRKQFDPRFVAAAFRLKDHEISPVFKSQFGYHIVQLVNREGNVAQVRHILLIPPITSGDVKKATAKLDTVRKKIIDGDLNFGQAASLYSTDDDLQGGTKNTGGMFTMPDGSTFMSMDYLDPQIVLILDSLKVGKLSRPEAFYPDPRMRDQKSVRIVYLKSRSEPHKESLETDYSRIQEEALQKKQFKVLDEWFDDHMSDYYLQISPEYFRCKNIKMWSDAAEEMQKNSVTIR